MNYAIIENNKVTNIVFSNRALQENWILTKDIPVHIGDTYEDGNFFRDGEKVISNQEYLRNQLAETQSALAILLGENIKEE